MELRGVLQGIPDARIYGDPSAEISSISHDSRTISRGGLFLALPGARTDGNRHVKDALGRGAAAVLSELAPPPPPMSLVPEGALRPAAWVRVADAFAAMGRAADNFFASPASRLCVVAVTGTTGKTTTVYFLESIFSRCGKTPGALGTISHRLAHRTIERACNTTPYSLDLLRLLARMRDGGATHVAMEVSSHALATKRVDEVDFDAAVLTNLQRDHLDFHKTLEAYFEAKARLFELLTKASSSKRGRAVLNRDDPAFARFARAAAQAPTFTYGFSPESDFRAGGLVLGRRGTSFRLRRAEREWLVQLRLLGRHNVYNALAAAAAAWSLDLSPEGILEGLGALERVPGRLESVEAGQPFSVLVDFAHTDAALASVLEAVGSLPHRRILTVFGCGGDRDAGKRGPMGVAACAASDLAVITSDNPRTEDPAAIIADIEQGIRQSGRENYKIVADRREAIYEAVRLAQPEDVVLIAGKGHEDAQILRDRSVPFDDRETARSALKDLGKI